MMYRTIASGSILCSLILLAMASCELDAAEDEASMKPAETRAGDDRDVSTDPPTDLLFMSEAHVERMNQLLAADPAVNETTAALERRYVVAYELERGPGGETVWWQMIFDPRGGLRFSLDAPDNPPDVTFEGEYAAMIRAMRALGAGEQVEMPLTTSGDAAVMETVAAAFAAGQQAATIKTEFPDVDTVVLETELGVVEIRLYPERAPVSVANFLAYVDTGLYDGAAFYRAAHADDPADGIGIVQGGLLADTYESALAGNDVASLTLDSPRPPIAHETTTETGLGNERGVVAWGRLEPGTASSEFFVNLSDNPGLDTGNTSRNPDGQGYATFGRVTKGLDVLEQIQERPTGTGPLSQVLEDRVIILRAYRK